MQPESPTTSVRLANEYGALSLMRQHTRMPVPRPLDLASDSDKSYLLTSRVSGVRLGSCIDTLSEDEEHLLVYDLQKYIGQLRAIPKDATSKYAIINAVNEACYDHRVNMSLDYDENRGDFVGPFVNEEQFNEILQTPALPGVSHCSGHKIVFTHSDLNMRNVLVHNGRLSGIVDWENSGWYPEYWDYTKAHFITKLRRRWLRIVDVVFKQYGDYENELATERQLWDYCHIAEVQPKTVGYILRGITRSADLQSLIMTTYKHASSTVVYGCMHWGLILTAPNQTPVLHHASNRAGPWSYEVRAGKPEKSMTLIVLVRVDALKSHSGATDVIKTIAADGSPSRRTGEAFTCRIWIKDVLMALHAAGQSALPVDIAVRHAANNAKSAESGSGATVINDVDSIGQWCTYKECDVPRTPPIDPERRTQRISPSDPSDPPAHMVSEHHRICPYTLSQFKQAGERASQSCRANRSRSKYLTYISESIWCDSAGSKECFHYKDGWIFDDCDVGRDRIKNSLAVWWMREKYLRTLDGDEETTGLPNCNL
ncbi:hypothetical protein PG988_010869 [Apiospora saccharicola]